MKNLANKILSSPTLMSWLSLFSRSVAAVAVLPVIFRLFPAGEIAVWQLISTTTVLLVIFDFGLTPTFSRFIAYTQAREKSPDTSPEARRLKKEEYERLVRTVVSTFTLISAGLVLFMLTAGTWALVKPISQMAHPQEGWIGWFAAVFCTGLSFVNGAFISIIQGHDHIALLRRWDSLMSIIGTLLSLAVVMATKSFVLLVVVSQTWLLTAGLRNYFLIKEYIPEAHSSLRFFSIDRQVLAQIWPSTWRSGLGVGLTSGLQNLSGVFLAQIAPASVVGPYLLAVKVCSLITQVSQAPFYSKLTKLNRLRHEKSVEELERLAAKGMRLSLLVCAAAGIAAYPAAKIGLVYVKSNITFVSLQCWALLSVAMFLERFGAMHMQLYSTTNDIRWHKAAIGFCAIYVTAALLLCRYYGDVGIALAWVCAAGLFYAPYCVRLSYSIMETGKAAFERKVSVPAFLLLALGLSTLFIGFK